MSMATTRPWVSHRVAMFVNPSSRATPKRTLRLNQVFLAQLAHPTIVASALKGDEQPQIALTLLTVFDQHFDTHLISM